MRYGATTRLSPERAIEKAKEYFKKLELTVQEESTQHLLLRSAAGFVDMTISMGEGTDLDIDTKGFDKQVKEFLQRVG